MNHDPFLMLEAHARREQGCFAATAALVPFGLSLGASLLDMLFFNLPCLPRFSLSVSLSCSCYYPSSRSSLSFLISYAHQMPPLSP